EVKFKDESLLYQVLGSCISQALAVSHVVAPMDFTSSAPPETIRKFQDQVQTIIRKPDQNPTKPYPPDQTASQKQVNQAFQKHNLQKWKELYREASKEGQYALKEIEKERKPNPIPPEHQDISKPPSQDLETDSGKDSKKDSSETAQRLPLKEDIEKGNVFLQWLDKYIIWLHEDGLTWIHHVRARERILYERFNRDQQSETGEIQKILFPQSLHLEERPARLMEELLPELHKIGFDLRMEDNQSFSIAGIPISCMEEDIIHLIQGFLGEYEGLSRLKLPVHESVPRALAKYAALPFSKKVLSQEEQMALVGELIGSNCPDFTPDGRPITRFIGVKDILMGFHAS
ncbi:MAG: hypothetical protein OXB93_02175, partial [Cytophagales bacterium]|nr:hypothetical protein [Cytophagales bacterium]